MKNSASTELGSLKEQLKKLDPEQRKQLLQKLNVKNPKEKVQAKSTDFSKATPVRIETVNGVERNVFPASHAQERMWFLHEYERHLPVYSSPTVFRLKGALNVDCLKRSFDDVVTRHDSLRTTFFFEGNGIYQMVHADHDFHLSVIDCVGLGTPENASELNSKLCEYVSEPFDLTRGPLLKVFLLRLEDDDYILLVVTHHIVSDGWSRANMFRELSKQYSCYTDGKSVSAEPLVVQISDYSAWQDSRFKNDSFRSHMDYWKQQLKGPFRPLDLPIDFDRPLSLESEGKALELKLDPDLVDRLRTIAESEGSTLFMVFLAAYSVLLHFYSDQEDIIVGVPIANRGRKESEPLIGCLMNSLAMRTQIRSASTFREILHQVKKVSIDAYTYQEVPYERLLLELDIERDSSRSPIFQSNFALQDYPEVLLDLDGVSCSKVFFHTNTSKTELGLEVIPSGEGWSYTVEYNTNLFRKETIADLVISWERLLEATSRNPNVKIGDLPDEYRPRGKDREVGRVNSDSSVSNVGVSNRPLSKDRRNHIKHVITDLWKELLKIDEPNGDESLFDLGGHSLTATLLSVKIQEALNEVVPVRAIFENSTLTGVIEFVSGNRAAQSRGDDDANEPSPEEASQRMTCFLVGTGRMPIEIVALLRRKGAHICGIGSRDGTLIKWAKNEGIRVQGADEDLKSFLETESFDYLFSVVNPQILRKEILRLPRKMAINFHDAPLPRFAGMNAPAWGVIKRQSIYGVTWHEIAPEIDAGDILKQVPVEISESDTFVSMGLKCVEAGVRSFEGLLDELKNDSIVRTKQNLKQRSYFNRYDRPTSASVLVWDESAEDLYAMKRGQDFGPLFNSMGSVKIILNDGIYNVGTIEVLDELCSEDPGSVLAVDENGLKVATSTKPIRLSSLFTIDGEKASFEELILRNRLSAGSILSIPSSGEADVLKSASDAAIRSDSFWRDRLHEYIPASFGNRFSNAPSSSEEVVEAVYRSITLPQLTILEKAGVTNTNAILASWSAFIARILEDEVFSIEYKLLADVRESRFEKFLLSSFLPLNVDLNLEHSFSEFQESVVSEISKAERYPVFGRDLVYRDPVLLGVNRLRKLHKSAIGFWHKEASGDDFEAGVHECVLVFNAASNHAELLYDPLVIHPYWAEKMVGWFTVFVTESIARPDTPISGISLVTTETALELRSRGHGERHTFPVEKTIHQLIEGIALLYPEKIAIEQGDIQLSYLEFNQLSNVLAHRLIGKGVGPDVQVGVCFERSPAMLVAVLGILKAGGAYVPLDPKYPKERLEYMVTDASLPLILFSPECVGCIGDIDAEIIALELDDLRSSNSEYKNPTVTLDSRNLAYVIYTSGSSGDPKGVLIEHYTLINYICSTIRICEVTHEDRVLQLASLNFDASAEEIYCAFFSGSTLVLRTEEMLSTPRDFVECLDDWKISFLPIPTAYWHSWVGAMKPDKLPIPSSLRMINMGGEAVSAQAITQWQSLVGDKIRLFNSYGPTETTIGASWFELTSYDCNQDRSVPIGLPIDNLTAYVLDSGLKPVPDGVAGELCLGGLCLARGYYRNPVLTEEKFVADPFKDKTESRIYRTGDKVVRKNSGYLVFLGRFDKQVKIRGFRIELGEIEARLTGHPSIKESVVIATELRGDKQLAAYFVSNDTSVTNKELREYLSESLPRYMVPTYFIPLGSIPRTGSQKIDRKALPVPSLERSSIAAEEVTPTTGIEKALAEIWADVLGLPNVGINENFFELGGHSLLASQVIARIQQEYQVKVPLRLLFDAPSVAQLSLKLTSLIETGEKFVPVEASKTLATGEEKYPVSFAQNRLWFLDRLKGSSPEYNISKTLVLKGDLKPKAVEFAINQIITRHEALRTRFAEFDGKAYQVVASEYSIEVPLIEIRGLSVIERDRTLRKESARGFDIQSLPLIDARLFQTAADEHILFIKMHHIVSDGWSFGVFNHEFSEAYNAFVEGRSPKLEPLQLQYPEYSVQQVERLQGDYLDEQLSHWKNYLANIATLELPTDRPRPLQATHNGARHLFEFSSDLAEKLDVFNKAERSTPFMSLMTVFQLLLARYSGQTDIAIGTPFANRGQIQEEAMIGFFVNTLVIRTDFSDDLSFKKMVREVRNASLDAFQHHEVPFEKLVEELNPKRDPSRHPLFQVMFAMQNAKMEDPDLKGLAISPLQLNSNSTHFDLSLSVMYKEGKWMGVFSYNTDLFNPDTIRRLSEHLMVLLDAVLKEPDKPVMEVPMILAEEKKQIVDEWGSKREVFPEDQTIHGLFEIQVRKNPDKTALVCDDVSFTYAELDERANQLAHCLQEKGVGPEVLVGVCIERSCELIISMLAIIKAGGAYVPLDPHFPPSRISMIMEDAEIEFLISQTSLKKVYDGFFGDLLLIDKWTGSGYEGSSCEAVENRHVAYVIFTSGSTGRPKGTVIEHKSAVNMLNSMTTCPKMSSDDVMLAIATVSFDISVFEIFGPLTVGAKLVVMPDRMRADGHELIRLFESCGANIMHCTPSYWKILLYAGWKGGPFVKALTGGEALTGDLAKDILPTCGELWNLYGPTETTVYSLATRIYNSDTITIGKPIGNTDIFIVNEKLQLSPIGVTGELLIGGMGLAREYLRRPDLTEDRFISNPYSEDPQSRLYRTGDVCRWKPDGTVECLGRMDNQVKIRGYRIELGDIESAMADHPTVREVVTKVWDDGNGGSRIVAYVVLDDPTIKLQYSDMARFLRERLPEYMIPSGIEFLEALPQTPNAKVDRKALSEPVYKVQSQAEGQNVATTYWEKKLALIWSEILGVNDPGIHASFFDLGGHSLLAFQVVSRMRSDFDVEVPLRKFFDMSTISGLASHLDELKPFESDLSDVIENQPIETNEEDLVDAEDAPTSVPVSGEVVPQSTIVKPVTYAQYRMWFIQQLEASSTAYNMPSALRIKGMLECEALRRTLETIIARHEPFRTTFDSNGGDPLQVIHSPMRFELPIIDLSHLSGEALDEEINYRILKEQRKAFDLSQGLMLRAHILFLAPKDHVLLITKHHIASDGWSHRIFWREFKSLYAAYSKGQPSPLEDLKALYSEVTLKQQERLKGDYWDELLGFWKQELSGVENLELPMDRPRPEKLSSRGAVEGISLDEDLVKGLRNVAVTHQVTFFMVLVSSFQLVLSRLSGQKDIIVGMPSAGRVTTDQEKLIGLFINTVLLRTHFEDDLDFGSLLSLVKDKYISGLDYQEMPFERLVEELAPERDLSRNPIFQVLVNMQEQEQGTAFELPELEIKQVGNSDVQTKFDLTLYISASTGSTRLRLVYSTDLFDATRIKSMLEQYRLLLEQVAKEPSKTVSSYSLTTDVVDKLLPSIREPMARPGQVSVVEQFFNQTSLLPDRAAVSLADREWSYSELGARVRELSSALRAMGISSEDRVLVSGDKQFGTIVSLLAVLVVGGVIVPIDPELPDARKEEMKMLTGARMLLTGQSSQLSGWFAEEGSKRVFVDQLTGKTPTFSDDTSESVSFFQPGPKSPAYIFFTSGTTGKPKGILGRYDGLNHFIAWEGDCFGISKNDRVAQLTSMSFDVSLRDIFLPLTRGAVLCLPPSDVAPLSPDAYVWLREQKITVLHTVPSVMESWVQTGLNDGQLPDLRWTFSAGEPLRSKLVEQWTSIALQTEVVNLYGPTESTLAKCYYQVPDHPRMGIQPIGQAIPNCAVMIMGADLRPCGVGELGEIVIRTPFTSLGYLNATEQEAKSFVQNPFINEEEDMWYRSGDLGRFQPDGTIDILGRIDDQVKIRGVRIEPKAIEKELELLPDVVSARVIGKKDKQGQYVLIAYIVAPAKPTQDYLYKQLAERLPISMIPSAFVLLDKIPLTLNGKLDRKALPEPKGFDTQPTAEFVAPRNDLEAKLASIFCEILELDKVSVDDNFFHLGGNSLSAVRLCYQVKSQMEKELRVASMFESPTVAKLSLLLASDREDTNYLTHLAGSGDGRPVFFTSGITRNALVFLDLANRLGESRPCYGVDLPEKVNGVEPLKTVEALAEHCVKEIQRIQPEGPYVIGGFSFGGLLAYETARQLDSLSAENSTVFIFDSYLRDKDDGEPSRIEKLKWIGRSFLNHHYRYVRYMFKRSVWWRICHKFRWGVHSPSFLPAEMVFEHVEALNSSDFHYQFEPKPSSITIKVFVVRESEFTFKKGKQVSRWKYCSDKPVEFYSLDSDHHARVLNDPHLEDIVKVVKESLD